MSADSSPLDPAGGLIAGAGSDLDGCSLYREVSTIAGLMNIVTDPVILVGRDDRILSVSAALGAALQISGREMVGRPWYEAAIPSDQRTAVREYVRAVVAGELDQSTGLTCRYRLADGRHVSMDWHCHPLRAASGDSESGAALFLFGQLPTTESDRTSRDLRELQVKYRSIVDNIATGVAVISPSMQILKLNRQMQAWFPQIKAEDGPVCYRTFNSPPLDSTCPWCPVAKTLIDGQVHEAITETPAGSEVRHYRIVSSPLTDEDGRIAAAIEMVDDITDQFRAEEAIRESEERFRTVVNASMDAIVACNNEGIITTFNPAAEKMFGHDAGSIVGSPLDPLLPEGMAERHQEMLNSYFATGEPNGAIGAVTELTARRLDGATFPVELTLSVAHHCEPATAVAIIRDITDRRAIQDQLFDLATQYSTMMDAVPAMVYVKDQEGRFKAVNQAFRMFYGKADSEILGKTSLDVFDQKYALLCQSDDEELFRTGKKVTRDAYKVVGPGGAERWFTTTKVPLLNAEGQATGLVGLVQDVTEAHQSREQLIQADKLAAIGTLAAGVAHEINNPIGFISSNLNTMEKYLAKIDTMLKQVVPKDASQAEKFAVILEDFKDAITESIEGSDRVKRIVADLKSFSRVDRSEAEYASINEGINTTLNIVWNELKYKCTVEKDLGDLPDFYCRLNQLNQVFMNILINAGHAIDKEQGTIAIRTWAETDTIYVSIKDDGKGIPPGNLKKVFEPFFTTKEVGKGTGLGLSLAYDIVAKHNGNIEVSSEPEKGTEFLISLPVGGVENER